MATRCRPRSRIDAGSPAAHFTRGVGPPRSKLPKTLKGLIRVQQSNGDPLKSFIRGFPRGKDGIFACLAVCTHDPDAVKLVASRRALMKISHAMESNISLAAILDDADLTPRDFVGIVTRCAYDFNLEVARGIFATKYPQMMAASMKRAMEPDATREREIHFQATGHMPSSKGIQIGIQQTNNGGNDPEPGAAPSVSRTARRIVRDLPPLKM